MSGTMVTLSKTPDPHWAKYMTLLLMELGLKRGWSPRAAHGLLALARFLNLGGGVPWVECYPGQLDQVLMNLLANAGQAVAGVGVIRVRVQPDQDGVAVRIQDSGPGIPPRVLSHIFELFFTTKPVGQGKGLGLSISYGIVERHHGRLTVDRELGKVTAFTVWLPLPQPAEADRAQDA